MVSSFFLLVFNSIFSSCFHLCPSDLGLSSWVAGFDLGVFDLLGLSFCWRFEFLVSSFFMLVFNLIFSSCFHLCHSDLGLSSWVARFDLGVLDLLDI